MEVYLSKYSQFFINGRKTQILELNGYSTATEFIQGPGFMRFSF
jgi:hypothetical protein